MKCIKAVSLTKVLGKEQHWTKVRKWNSYWSQLSNFKGNNFCWEMFCSWKIYEKVYVAHCQWWSLETKSWDPFLRVLVSKVSGLVSVSKATTGLETLNIAKILFS